MSATIFDHKAVQLKEPLILQASKADGEPQVQLPVAAGSGSGAQPAELQESSSSSSLNSSRKTLKGGTQARDSAFEEGVILELSPSPEGPGDTAYYPYKDREDREEGSMERDEENDSDEEENDSDEEQNDNGSRDDELLVEVGGGTIVNESGKYSTLPKPYNPVVESVVCKYDRKRSKWEEAALYAREGEDNAKFYQHPNSKWSKFAYDTLHHFSYHILHLVISILLMALAFAESPAVGQEHLTPTDKKILVSVHGVLEIFFLTLLGGHMVLKWVWLGTKHFLRQRTVLITVILLVMYIEVLTVLIRQQNHIRVTRLLRPVFLIDTDYMAGVRRVLRQIFASIRPILHVLFLLMFFIIVFSIFAYLIFSSSDPDYFETYGRSFVSLFITQTTANNPDVMMEAYAEHPATPIFFAIYFIVAVYFSSNILLAVVYSSFSAADKKKFRKLLCHKIDALTRVFHILSYDPDSDVQQIQFHDFVRFMAIYKPRMPEWQMMCIFKALHRHTQDQYQAIGQDDFYRFYEMIDFKWEQVDSSGGKFEWFSRFSSPIKKPIRKLFFIVNHKAYKFMIGIVVLINLVFFVAYVSRIENNEDRFIKLRTVLPVSFVFLGIYMLDILFNIIGHGPSYFKKFWNVADFVMVILSFVCLCLELNPNFSQLAIMRPLKLLRLVRLKGQYRDIMNTMVALVPRLLSITFLILIIYYSFAIVGMEFFSFKVSQGCCNESWYGVSLYYSASADHANGSNVDSSNVYFLNNFNNILRSYVTLFILMVVNNWYIIMEGFASAVDEHPGLTRLYFMSFYIITLVVLQVVIAFIVEAFVVKIQAAQRRRTCTLHPNVYDCDCGKAKKKTVIITLVEEDVAKLRYEEVYLQELMSRQRLTLNGLVRRSKRIDFTKIQNPVNFVGRRDHTKEDVHIIMYQDEIKSWIKTFKKQSQKRRVQKKSTLKEAMKKAVVTTGTAVMDFFWE